MIKNCSTVENQVYSFLSENNNSISPPISSMPGGILGVIRHCKENGGISIFEKNNDIVSFMGYLLEEYRLYIYLLITCKKFRKRYSISRNIIIDLYKIAHKNKCEEIVFKAYKNEAYSNTIYSKLAYKIIDTLNAQGVPANQYHIYTSDLRRFTRDV